MGSSDYPSNRHLMRGYGSDRHLTSECTEAAIAKFGFKRLMNLMISGQSMCCGEVNKEQLLSSLIRNQADLEKTFLDIEDVSNHDASAEIELEIEAESSLCCEHFIDFVENYLFPWMLEGIKNTKSPPRHFTDVQAWYEAVVDSISKVIDEMKTTNCNSWFKLNRDHMKGMDPSQLQQRINERRINDSFWWISEFDKCVNGEDFDFSNWNPVSFG